MKGIYVSLLALLALVHAESPIPGEARPPKCKTYRQPKYPRSFTGCATGPKHLISNFELSELALGDCATLDEHAENMRTYFKGYGVEADERMTKDPYAVNNHNPRFEIVPFSTNPEADHRLLVSTFFEFASYQNTKFWTAQWMLRAKADLNGTRGEMPAGTWALYGVHRFVEDGKSFCVRFNDVAPMEHSVAGGNAAIALSLEAYHDYWGKGEIEAIYRSTEESGSLQFFMNFSG